MKRNLLTFIPALVLLSVAGLFAGPEKSQSLVAEAWQAWEGNDQQQVEQKFLAAIQEDPGNTRAYLGLSMLYEFQDQHAASWQAFQNILRTEKDFYPYVYAAWFTPRLRSNLANSKSGVIALMEQLSQKADRLGILQAMANGVAGEYYQGKGDLAKAKRFYENMNVLRDWMLIGPFDNVSASGFDNVYPPELEFDAAKTYEGKNGIPAQWFKVTATRHDGWIDHRRYFAYFQSVFYGNTFVYSPQRQAVQIRIGTSGSLKAFLNDELLVACFDENNNDLDTYVAATELQAGWNRLLIKCGFSEIDQCNFMVRLTDEAGAAIPGLNFSTAPQAYQRRPGAPVKLLENFAENFFKKEIEDHPDHPENYILLASCYLRNDKAIEAELVLREAVRRWPTCAAFQYHLMEAYLRGEKYDERTTSIEKIHALDPNVPRVLEYKINEYLENEDYDKAEALIRRLEQMLPGSEEVDAFYFQLYTVKQQFEKVIELANQAYQRHPDSWGFVYLQAALAIETTKKFDRALDLIKTYLKQSYDAEALIALADVYLKTGEVKKWEQTYTALLELDPAATGYYSGMADTYLAMQDYGNAEKMMKRAIAVCPNSSNFWAKLGEIYRAKNALDAAQDSFSEALRYQPANYEAREQLRELEGRTPIFSRFETLEIADLIKNAPQASDYPNDKGVILWRDSKRVVYERGVSESSEEMLVKLFNKNGIDQFKEYWISYNAYTEALIVEKAVVIKADGAEIKADIDGGHLVFKSLEENDCVYVKWRIKNYYSGKLSNHFWDTALFSRFYPVKRMRYALLAPENFKFQYRAQNMPAEPVTKRTEDGVIYQWSVTDEPAVQYEVGMPSLEEVGKVLYVSSIENWEYLVQWYSDLARTKARSSFEIKEAVAKLFQGRENLSQDEKIRIIYDYISENIRYSSVSFRQSGLIPQEARDVLVTRIGDCKDMTTLCLAMLAEVGVQGHYVLVNTDDRSRNLSALPAISFNHCIAGVETEAGVRYLDLTAHNYPMAALPAADLEAFTLPIKAGITAPISLPRAGSMSSVVSRHTTVTVRPDNGMMVQSVCSKSGEAGASMRDWHRHKGAAEREKNLTQSLARSFPNVKLLKLELANLDTLKPVVEYVYQFEVPDYVTETGQFKLFKMLWTDELTASEALAYESRKYSCDIYWMRADTMIEEIEIRLPAGYTLMELPAKVELSSTVADYAASYSAGGDVIKAKRVLITKKRVVAPEEYLEFKTFYNQIVKEDSRQILLENMIELSGKN